MDTTKGLKNIGSPSNKYNLKSWIHDIHNFLRNSGAGYGMKPLNIFSLFYGLMRMEEYDMLSKFNFNDETMKFSNLVRLSKESNKDENKLNELINIIRDNPHSNILDKLYGTSDDHPLRDIMFYEIPKHITSKVFAQLILRINTIKDIEKQSDVQLAGKVYEYFIGRDESAISALGAFFTDRPIPKLVFNKLLELKLDENGNVPTMIDPFGGSGGFVSEYINKYNTLFPSLDWSTNINNIYHYDMNEDVVKISGLEMMCLTKTTINMNKTINSFKYQFNNMKFKDVISNPPYGGDSFDSDLISSQNALLKEVNKRLKGDMNNKILKQQKRYLDNEIKLIRENHSKDIVSIDNSSKRIKDYAEKHKLIGTCKEIVSMILFMDLLEENGRACIVMKQGFFFDKSKQYVKLRKHLIHNFNVEKIIKIPEGSFENTNCVTSIIIFHNNGPTTSIEFSDLIVKENIENTFSVDKDGYVYIKEKKGDINKVDYNIIKSIDFSDINNNEINSFDLCDYSNFILKENQETAFSFNMLDIIDLNHENKTELQSLTRDTYYDFNIGCLEKNKIIKYKDIVNKENVKQSHILKENDIIISCCRPNNDKTRLISKNDILTGYTTGISKCRVKEIHKDKYPPIYVYSILYQIIGDKSKKGHPRNNAERMFAKSTNYPTIKLDMFKHINIPLHKDDKKITEWTQKLNQVYDIDMKQFKSLSRDMFEELIDEFKIYSK